MNGLSFSESFHRFEGDRFARLRLELHGGGLFYCFNGIKSDVFCSHAWHFTTISDWRLGRYKPVPIAIELRDWHWPQIIV
jgi:hypothetical protein